MQKISYFWIVLGCVLAFLRACPAKSAAASLPGEDVKVQEEYCGTPISLRQLLLRVSGLRPICLEQYSADAERLKNEVTLPTGARLSDLLSLVAKRGYLITEHYGKVVYIRSENLKQRHVFDVGMPEFKYHGKMRGFKRQLGDIFSKLDYEPPDLGEINFHQRQVDGESRPGETIRDFLLRIEANGGTGWELQIDSLDKKVETVNGTYFPIRLIFGY